MCSGDINHDHQPDKGSEEEKLLNVLKNGILVITPRAWVSVTNTSFMKLPIYQIDAFASELFTGNPAAVCPLEEWISETLMQQIAEENNLSETVFFVQNGDVFDIRWFTPENEVDLCGHATLAAAHVLFEHLGYTKNIIPFYSHRSGELSVTASEKGVMTLNFPMDELTPMATIPEVEKALGKKPIAQFKGKTDYMLVYEHQEDIASLTPNFFLLNELDCRGIIITAPGIQHDFVSRFFAPKCGILEDPVTGSAHTSLTPFWAKQLNKTSLTAKQLSKRGGELSCELKEDRVHISGTAKTYLIGELVL